MKSGIRARRSWRRRSGKLLRALTQAVLLLAVPALAQPFPTKPLGGLDSTTMIGNTSLTTVVAQAAAAIPHRMVGAASGVAPLNAERLVPRVNLPANMLNLATRGAALDGSAPDATTIGRIYAAAPADSVLAVPLDGRLPYSGLGAIVHSGGPVMWDLLGTNYTGPSGTMPTSYALGDGDLTESYAGGRLNFMRQWLTSPADNTKPNVLVQFDNSAALPQTNYGLYPQIDAFRVIGNEHTGATGSMDVGHFILNDLSASPYASQNVAIQTNVNKYGNSADWGGDLFFQDVSGRPPQAFSQVGMEYDLSANGPDNAATAYNPSTGNRVFLWLSPGLYTPATWASGKSFGVGNLVVATDAAGVQAVYVAQSSGITATIPPVWPNGGTVTDGGVRWAYGEPYAVEYGRGIWLDNAGSALTSYGSGFGTNGRFVDAVIDISEGLLIKSTSAGIRMAANMPIDFTGDGTAAGQNQHTLAYSSGSSALVYSTASNAAAVTVDDGGGAKFDGSLEVHGTTLKVNRNLDVYGQAIMHGQFVAPFRTPASSRTACTAGQQEADTNYVYVCVASNTWKRAALGSF